jgi:cholesterol oxidase
MSATRLDEQSHTAWISQGYERLINRVRIAPQNTHFDILIVGSGYGGAVAAETFAGRTHGSEAISIGVLERGREYLPGSFSTGLAELPGHLRLESNRSGLFDIRAASDVITVVANGVGGGSLINAGVMEVPAENVFESGWPRQFRKRSEWQEYFDRASSMLGAVKDGEKNTIRAHVDGVPSKFRSIEAIALQNRFRAAAITVAMDDTINSGNVRLNKCVRCGDCVTGCNFGAKNSLDVNLLVNAHRRGAEIFSGVTVLSVEREAGGFIQTYPSAGATAKS